MTTTITPLRQAIRLAWLLSLTSGWAASALAQPTATSAAAPAAAQLAEQAFERGAPVPAWVERLAAIPADKSNDALSIRLADLQFHVGDTATFYQHRAVVAHEASSLTALGQIDIEFQPAYQRVQLHKLAVLRGREVIDKLASAEIRFLQRERSLEQGIYDGSVTAQIVSSDLRVGDTLEIEYSVSGQNPVFGRHTMQNAQWDYASPVALRRVSIDAPDGSALDYRMIGSGEGKQPRQSEQHRDGRRLLRFEASGLSPVLGENYVPSDVQQFRWLQFSDFRDWAEVNAWAQELFSAPTAPGVLEGALKSARAAKTQEQAVAKVLEFVQNEIRYLSVSLGENSHRPFPPAQVLERRYGDCKDKSLLAVTMLRALGIEAWPVLVASYTTGGLDQMLPSPTLFDHAIVRVKVNGKEYYLDPTRRGQYGELARMGQVHGGRQVLVVKPDTTALVTIPRQGGELVRGKRSERIEVAAMEQPAEMVERIEVAGVSAENVRVQLARMSKQELRKAYEGALVKRYPEAQLVGEPLVQDDRQRNTLAIEVRHKVPNLFTPNGDSWSMNYTPSNLTELFAPPGNAHRSFPLVIPPFPDSQEYDLTVNLPSAFAIPAGRQTRNVDDAAFRLARTLEVGKNTMHLNMQLAVMDDRVAPARLPQYLKNMQQYNDMLGGSLRAFRSDMVGNRPAAAAAPAAGAVATPAAAPVRLSQEARLQQLLVSTGRVIADADTQGRDASAALCERAMAHAWLGHKNEALKDVARVVQWQPQADDTLRCRADVYYVLGRFRESEADYARLLARGSGQADMLLARGMAGLYQNKAGAAQSDFRAAASKAEGDGERLRAAILYQLAGGSEALPAAAGGDADLAWLDEVRAMFAGSTDPERMLSGAARNLPAGFEGRLVEAYYYAGRYYLSKGQATRARAYFQRAVDKRVLDNIYHVAAQHELARP